MIILYTKGSASPNIRKILTMLHETGLPYTIKRVSKQANGTFAADFLAINPNGTVPAIVDDATQTTIFESGAILQYLAEKADKFLPKTLHARGEVLKWLMFEVANMGPVMGELFHYMLLESNEVDDVHLQRYRDKLKHHCSILNHHLADHEYLGGDYSIADIALYPWMVIMEDMAEIKLADYPHLQNWEYLISNRPAILSAKSLIL